MFYQSSSRSIIRSRKWRVHFLTFVAASQFVRASDVSLIQQGTEGNATKIESFVFVGDLMIMWGIKYSALPSKMIVIVADEVLFVDGAKKATRTREYVR